MPNKIGARLDRSMRARRQHALQPRLRQDLRRPSWKTSRVWRSCAKSHALNSRATCSVRSQRTAALLAAPASRRRASRRRAMKQAQCRAAVSGRCDCRYAGGGALAAASAQIMQTSRLVDDARIEVTSRVDAVGAERGGDGGFGGGSGFMRNLLLPRRHPRHRRLGSVQVQGQQARRRRRLRRRDGAAPGAGGMPGMPGAAGCPAGWAGSRQAAEWVFAAARRRRRRLGDRGDRLSGAPPAFAQLFVITEA